MKGIEATIVRRFANMQRFNKESLVRLWLILLLVCIQGASLGLMSCSTGIESTKTIKLSRSDARAAAPSLEKLLADSILSEPLANWFPGREFLATDSKVMLLFEGRSVADTAAIANRKLVFTGADEIIDAGGNRRARISFKIPDNPNSDSYTYLLRKPLEEAKITLTGLDLPMLIDMKMVESAKKLLIGRSFWTRSGLWYDKNGINMPGLRFIPVRIEDVRPGNRNFPLFLEFRTADNETACYYMNVSAPAGSGAESRTFPELFSISDPRKLHKNISDENWALIQRNRVTLGMTKEECRLALGNPSDVASGHNWSNTIDFWGYPDGKFLRFEDGLLVEYR